MVATKVGSETLLVAGTVCLAAHRLAYTDRAAECLGLIALLLAPLSHTQLPPKCNLSLLRSTDARHAPLVGLALIPVLLAALSVSTVGDHANYCTLFLALSLVAAAAKANLCLRGSLGTATALITAVAALLSLGSNSQGLALSGSILLALSVAVLSALTLITCLRVLPRCFTLSEAMIVSDFLVLGCCDAVFATVAKTTNDLPGIFYLKRIPIQTLMSTLILGMLLIGLASCPILRQLQYHEERLAKLVAEKDDKMTSSCDNNRIVRLSFMFFGTAAGLVLALIRPWTMLLLDGADPFLWLVKFVLEKPFVRAGLLGYWAVLMTLGVFFAVRWFGQDADSKKDTSSSKARGDASALSLKELVYLNFKRKYYHALVVAMFVPGYLIDPDLMHLSFSVAFSVLILTEYIRVFRVWPIGHHVHAFLRGFLDSKDQGIVILSHIYLLVGCALPVWINRIHISAPTPAGLLGILALGVADACASVAGYRWGRSRWPRRAKTVEGTAAFVASMVGSLGFCAAFAAVDMGGAGLALVGKIFAVAIFLGFLEAASAQNDNLVLPICGISLWYLLTFGK
ncbi:hypothetical protein BC830DRAFT_1138899 [Chytriomyces sp. MP71]|nr:hypothetical protein BC830DRAFT_1138899 [Chytriomyces sp. MP71]